MATGIEYIIQPLPSETRNGYLKQGYFYHNKTYVYRIAHCTQDNIQQYIDLRKKVFILTRNSQRIMQVSDNFLDTPAKTQRAIATCESNASASKAIGTAACVMGGVALLVGVINACRGNYEWTALNAFSGAFAEIVGVINLNQARKLNCRVSRLKRRLQLQQTSCIGNFKSR